MHDSKPFFTPNQIWYFDKSPTCYPPLKIGEADDMNCDLSSQNDIAWIENNMFGLPNSDRFIHSLKVIRRLPDGDFKFGELQSLHQSRRFLKYANQAWRMSSNCLTFSEYMRFGMCSMLSDGASQNSLFSNFVAYDGRPVRMGDTVCLMYLREIEKKFKEKFQSELDIYFRLHEEAKEDLRLKSNGNVLSLRTTLRTFRSLNEVIRSTFTVFGFGTDYHFATCVGHDEFNEPVFLSQKGRVGNIQNSSLISLPGYMLSGAEVLSNPTESCVSVYMCY